MPLHTTLTHRLGLSHPVIQAPMAGGATTPDLVVEVCEAGALGFLAGAYGPPAQILETARAIRARTSRPFGVNLFAPLPPPDVPDNAQAAVDRIAPFHEELGLSTPSVPEFQPVSFTELLTAALDSGASVFSFTFGTLPPDAVAAIKERGLFLIGTATTVDEAVALERTGVDAVVAQGSEAGAHRGTFGSDFGAAMVGTMTLVPQIVDAVSVPVIAAGGIMDGRGVAAALALGASAVQMGTAFLTCEETGIPEAHKKAILAAREHDTRVTRAFSGRPARGIVNRFMETVEDPAAPDAVLPFPLQNTLTQPLRAAAARQGRPEFLSLWAGQGVRLARRESAARLIDRLAREADAAAARLTPSV